MLNGYRVRFYSLVFSIVCLAVLSGCASYQMQMSRTQTMIRSGNARDFAESIKEKAFADGKDQVVFLLEYGTAMQIAGDYEESNKAFLLAEELTEVKDYYSISNISASILTSAAVEQYKGEDYEKVLINAMLAINFLMMGNQEAAMVETRKLNDKLYKYKFEAKRNYEQNPFAFYLAAMIREEDKDWDGAFIDYQRVQKLNPTVNYLKYDLVRSAANARRYSEVKKFKSKYGLKTDHRLAKGQGEIVMVYLQGWGPQKKPNLQWRSIPELHRRYSTTRKMKLVVDDKMEAFSEPVYNASDVAIKTLNDAYAGIIAKRIAGRVAKKAVADQLAKENELLGAIAHVGLIVSDRADLRHWFTLPNSFQVARIAVPAGEHSVSAEGLTEAGAGSGELMKPQTVTVKAGKKAFLLFRSVN
ncbi:MAG: hypothetical protein AAF202_00945 [Pseudomonadota bacterium]